ncbi:MAG: diguanylate cyclase [Planctomycetales bacterium]|nr:diguanylate cyclase [Planctomycetales bacterium]
MKRLGTTTRIAFAMSMWSAVVLLGLRICGILDDGNQEVIRQRTRLCETIAVSCSQFASRGDHDGVRVVLASLVKRNADVLSAACRPRSGGELLTAGDHENFWPTVDEPLINASVNRISVTVMAGKEPWGQVEIAFKPPVEAGIQGLFFTPSARVIALAVCFNLLGFLYTLRRCFCRLDPAQAVPDRVRAALNTLAEGVLVLDSNRRIMLANEAIAALFEESPDSLQGKTIRDLPWHREDEGLGSVDDMIDELLVPRSHDEDTLPVHLRIGGLIRTFKPNASPIEDRDGASRGTLLSLDDITVLAQRTRELRETMSELERSRGEIQEQNEQLRYLATRDPMTGCLNRRSFFELAATTWQEAGEAAREVSVIMVDVDHFKSINDQHGHATGDEVLKRVASVLLETARDTDFVCRFGGEEFCVLLTHDSEAGAAAFAEKLRAAIEGLQFAQLSVTASFGCATSLATEAEIETLLESADQSLYKAKRSGRNRVVCAERGETVNA